jgi:hypothetical protein
MSLKKTASLFNRLLKQLIDAGDLPHLDELSAMLGYKSPTTFEAWLRHNRWTGDLDFARRIGQRSRTGQHELLVAWLCDHDPDGQEFYEDMLTRLTGDPGRAKLIIGGDQEPAE